MSGSVLCVASETVCTHCKGKGHTTDSEGEAYPCEWCDGTGRRRP